MSNAVSWILMVNVKDGELDNFRAVMDDMVTATQAEPGAEIYEWFISDDNKSVHIYERYADSAATLTHVMGFGKNFAERFFGSVDPAGWYVYGNPDEAVSEALQHGGAVLMGNFGGFAR